MNDWPGFEKPLSNTLDFRVSVTNEISTESNTDGE